MTPQNRPLTPSHQDKPVNVVSNQLMSSLLRPRHGERPHQHGQGYFERLSPSRIASTMSGARWLRQNWRTAGGQDAKRGGCKDRAHHDGYPPSSCRKRAVGSRFLSCLSARHRSLGFTSQKALRNHAELTGYVYLWEGTRAFTTQQRLLPADQYEIVDVRTDRGTTRAMLFPKAILKAEWDAAAPLRDGLTIRRERWRGLRLEKGKNGQRPDG
jgi:hypothetical protein